jgi:hypothetical protein
MIKKAEIQSEKDRILAVLAGTDRLMSPNEINRGIGGYLKSHTIRQRLKDLVTEEKVVRSGDKRGTKYRIADDQGKVIRAALPKTETNLRRAGAFQISQPAKKVFQYVTTPILSRITVGYQKSLLDEYQPNITSYLTAEETGALFALGRMETQTGSGSGASAITHDRLMIDLTFNSARLDGNTYSLLDVEKLIKEGATADGKTALEAEILTNHQSAIEFLLEPKEQIRLNRFVIINLHAYLSEGLLGSPAAEGRLRARAMRVDIDQSTYVPPSIPHIIEECFESTLSKAREIRDPYEQAFFLLVHLAYLQPFEEVSKRVSRLAANIPLLRNNLRPLSFIDVPERLYTQALLGVYELADVSLLKDVFLWAYRRSALHNKAVTATLPPLEPIRSRYQSLIKRSVRELVEAKTSQALVAPAIAWLLGKDVKQDERQELANVIQEEMMALNVEDIERFQISKTDYKQWSAIWLDQ